MGLFIRTSLEARLFSLREQVVKYFPIQTVNCQKYKTIPEEQTEMIFAGNFAAFFLYLQHES